MTIDRLLQFLALSASAAALASLGVGSPAVALPVERCVRITERVREVLAWAERRFAPAGTAVKLHGHATEATYEGTTCDGGATKTAETELGTIWDFIDWPGRGSVPAPALSPSASDLDPTFTPVDNGSYTVRLTALGEFGDRLDCPVPGGADAACDEVSVLVTDVSDLAPNRFFGTALEVTQAIQDLANRVPLIAGKVTYVRFHVKSDIKEVPGVGAQLTGRRGGVVLAGSPIASQNATTPAGTITVKPIPKRGELNDSFWFRLPLAWTNAPGALTLTVELNPSCAVLDRDCDNNTDEITLTLQEAKPLKLVPVRVEYHVPFVEVAVPTWGDYNEVADYLLKTYPINRIEYHDVHPFEDFTTTTLCDFSSACGWYDLLAELWWANLWTFDCGQSFFHPFRAGCRWHALVPREAASGDIVGIANTLPTGRESVSRLLNPTDDNREMGTMAQEIAHLFGRLHTCSEAVSGGDCPHGEQYVFGIAADEDFPYPHGKISSGGAYGLDYDRARAGIPPTVLDAVAHVPDGPGPHDFMSYGDGPRWVSDYTYKALADDFGVSTAITVDAPAVVIPPLTDHLIVTVLLFADGRVDVKPFYHMLLPPDSYDDPDGRGNYELTLFDGAGTVLFTRFFTPLFWSDRNAIPEVMLVAEILPYPPATARIVLRRPDQRILLDRAVTAHPPRVRVITPNGGEIARRSLTVRWEGADDDGDRLTYFVLYSGDGGQTWRLVGNGVRGTRLDVDTRRLPGGDQSLIRVVATDGVNTAEDVSDGFFHVRPKAPQVTITTPLQPTMVVVGDRIRLEGQAFDPQTNDVVPDDLLAWFSNLDGPLGIGPVIEVDGLSIGRHLITLAAESSQSTSHTRRRDQATVVVKVQPGPSLDVAITKIDVTRLCAPTVSHVLEISWRTENGRPPVQVRPISVSTSAGVILQNHPLPPLGNAQIAVDVTAGGPAMVRVGAEDHAGAHASVHRVVRLDPCVPKAFLGVVAVADGIATVPVSVHVSILVSRVGDRLTPFGVLEEPGSSVRLTAPASINVQGRTLGFRAWRRGLHLLARTPSVVVTIGGNVSLHADYAPAP